MPSKDGGDYRQARRKDAAKGKPPEDEGMFFGASPQQKKELRETKDTRGINLDDLNLDALDREKFGAGEKVGESMRLIDMAMGDEPPATGRRPGPQRRGRPGPRRAGPPRGRPGRRAPPTGRVARPSGRPARPGARPARPSGRPARPGRRARPSGRSRRPPGRGRPRPR